MTTSHLTGGDFFFFSNVDNLSTIIHLNATLSAWYKFNMSFSFSFNVKSFFILLLITLLAHLLFRNVPFSLPMYQLVPNVPI